MRITPDSIDQEILQQLSEIDGFKSWTGISPYRPEKHFVPDREKLKTGVLDMPPRPEQGAADSERLYIVTEAAGSRLLLRTRPIEFYEQEAALAAFCDRIFREGKVYAPAPREVGPYAGDSKVYSLYAFFGGDNLARRLQGFYTPQQLSFGIEAGRLLRKFHSVKPRDGDPHDKYNVEALLESLSARKVKYKGQKEATDFLLAHKVLLAQRPVCALHGSFSANALFIDKNLNIGFNPLTKPLYGDPISDLATLGDSYSLPFIKGVIKGLYDGVVPKNFFELLAFYTTVRSITDIVEATAATLAPALQRAAKIAADYTDYQSSVPIWY